MDQLKKFVLALSELTNFDMAETLRQQANGCEKDGNVYYAALLRESANRIDRIG